MYLGPLINRNKERPYVPPNDLKEDVESYLQTRVHSRFTRTFTLRRFVMSTVQDTMREVFGNPNGLPDSVWVDLGLNEIIDTRDEAFEIGLKDIGKKYGIELSIHPSSYTR